MVPGLSRYHGDDCLAGKSTDSTATGVVLLATTVSDLPAALLQLDRRQFLGSARLNEATLCSMS